jgi:hypothetical protein
LDGVAEHSSLKAVNAADATNVERRPNVPLIHSADCQRGQAAFQTRLAEYDASWPNACRQCDGLGWSEGYDSVPVPFGPGNCLMPSGEPCECTCDADDRGVCPRCRKSQPVGFDAFIDERMPCAACGWKWGERNGDIRPAFECWGDCVLADDDPPLRDACPACGTLTVEGSHSPDCPLATVDAPPVTVLATEARLWQPNDREDESGGLTDDLDNRCGYAGDEAGSDG